MNDREYAIIGILIFAIVLSGAVSTNGRSTLLVCRGETLLLSVSLLPSSLPGTSVANQEVEFYVETYDLFLGTGLTDESGRVDFQWTIPYDFPVGPIVLNATYRGNESLALAPCYEQFELVVLASTTITIQLDPVNITLAPGDFFVLRASLQDDRGAPLAGKRITVASNEQVIGYGTTDANGSVSLNISVSLSWAVIGENELSVCYLGDNTSQYYASSHAYCSVSIARRTSQFTPISVPYQVTVNTTVMVTTVLDSLSQPIENADVLATLDDRTIGTFRTDHAGMINITIHADQELGLGNHSLTVFFEGSDRYDPASYSLSFAVTSPTLLDIQSDSRWLIGSWALLNVSVTDALGRSVSPALVVLESPELSLYCVEPVVENRTSVEFSLRVQGSPGKHTLLLKVRLNEFLENVSCVFSVDYAYQHRVSVRTNTLGFSCPHQEVVFLVEVTNETGPLAGETASLLLDGHLLGAQDISSEGTASFPIWAPSSIGTYEYMVVLSGRSQYELNATSTYILRVRTEIPARLGLVEYTVEPPLQEIHAYVQAQALNGTSLGFVTVQFTWLSRSVVAQTDAEGFAMLHLPVPNRPGTYVLFYETPSGRGLAASSGFLEIVLKANDILSSQGVGIRTFFYSLIASFAPVTAVLMKRRAFSP